MFIKFLFLILFSLTIQSCSSFGEVVIFRDNFKKAHIVNLKLALESNEIQPESWSLYKVILDFTREIGDEKTIPTIVRFTVNGSRLDNSLERTGFIRIGNKNDNLIFGNLATQSITTVRSRTNTSIGGLDSFGKPVPGGLKTGVTVSSKVSKEFTGTFLLSLEQERDIQSSKNLVIRFYAGAWPITVSIQDEDLESLKYYLRAKPGMEQE